MITKAKIIGSAPIIAVPNVQETIDYYTEKLGFELIAKVMEPPVYGMVQRDGFQLHFGKSENFSPNNKHRDDLPDFILWIPEIDIYFGEVKQKGVTIVTPITQRPYGSREFIIKDLNGYHILIGD